MKEQLEKLIEKWRSECISIFEESEQCGEGHPRTKANKIGLAQQLNACAIELESELAKVKSPWIPVEERKPRPFKMVLCLRKGWENEGHLVMPICAKYDHGVFWSLEDPFRHFAATHWQEIAKLEGGAS